MVDFSLFVQSDAFQPLVQENLLEQQFEESLFPELLFRNLVTKSEKWISHLGDTKLFTADGLLKPKTKPKVADVDPTPSVTQKEQWAATLQQWDDTQDVKMVGDYLAIASLFLRATINSGLQAGRSLNRIIRDRFFNMAEAGWTVADGAQSATTSLKVKRLNGFTTARNTNAGGSLVRHDPITSSNYLDIEVWDTSGSPAYVSRRAIAFEADDPNDQLGPGTLTLNSAVTVADRAVVKAGNRTYVTRVGGGDKTDDIGSTDIPTMDTVSDMVGRMRQSLVPEMGDGTYHCHMDPRSEILLFKDPAFQNLHRGTVFESEAYAKLAITRMLGCTFYRNVDNPLDSTVDGGATATYDEPFAPELWSNGNASTGVRMHRMLFVGAGAMREYVSDLSELLTEAGVQGKVSNNAVATPNGIELNVRGVQWLLRAPQNRTMDVCAVTWKFMGTWVARPDSMTGDRAKYKRVGVAIHGE